jgi:hypothetical protein
MTFLRRLWDIQSVEGIQRSCPHRQDFQRAGCAAYIGARRRRNSNRNQSAVAAVAPGQGAVPVGTLKEAGAATAVTGFVLGRTSRPMAAGASKSSRRPELCMKSSGPENAAARNGRTQVRQLVACHGCRNFAMSMPRRSLADALNFGSNQNACSCD